MRFYTLALAGVVVAGCAQNKPQDVAVAQAAEDSSPAPIKKVAVSPPAPAAEPAGVPTPTYAPVQIGPPPGATPEPSLREAALSTRQRQIARQRAVEAAKLAANPPTSQSSTESSGETKSLLGLVNQQIDEIENASSARRCRLLGLESYGVMSELRRKANNYASSGNSRMTMIYANLVSAWESLGDGAMARATLLDGGASSSAEVDWHFQQARHDARTAMQF